MPAAVVVDLDLLLSEAAHEVSEGWLPAEAARLVLGRLEPDQATSSRLKEVGLAQLINERLSARRDTSARPAVVGMLPAERPGEDLLSVPAASADGSMKPWLVWSVGDWRAWEAVCEAQADGWARRQDGSREIAALLEKRGVDRVADLSAAEKNAVRQIIRGFRA